MQAVILASETYSITRSKWNGMPVSLVPVAGRPVIEHILRFLCSDDSVGTIHICTGSRGYPQFIEWLKGCDYTGRVELFNGNHTAGGIVAELLNFTSKKIPLEDILVLPGDHIPDFQAGPFLRFCAEKDGDVVGVVKGRAPGTMERCGVAAVTSRDRVIGFEVDPPKPKASLVAFPLIKLSAATIPFLTEYVLDGNDTRCIESFLAWSYRIRPLYAFLEDGGRYQGLSEAPLKKISSKGSPAGKLSRA